MPDPHWDSPDGQTHSVGDGCQLEHAAVPDPHDDQWRGRSRRIGLGSDRLHQNGFYGIDWLAGYAADVDLELQSLRAQLADFQRGAAEEARQGDLAREEVTELRDENTRLKSQVTSLLTTLTQDDFPDPAILHADCRSRLAAALAVVEAARKYRDNVGQPAAVALTEMLAALEAVDRHKARRVSERFVIDRSWGFKGFNSGGEIDDETPCPRCQHLAGWHYSESLAPGRPRPLPIEVDGFKPVPEHTDRSWAYMSSRRGCAACDSCAGFDWPGL